LIDGGQRESAQIEAAMIGVIEAEAPLAHIDFVSVADTSTLAPTPSVEGDVLIALAVSFGGTRLIDNMIVRFEDRIPHFS
jgi:pantoate--beta-alanine ligase